MLSGKIFCHQQFLAKNSLRCCGLSFFVTHFCFSLQIPTNKTDLRAVVVRKVFDLRFARLITQITIQDVLNFKTESGHRKRIKKLKKTVLFSDYLWATISWPPHGYPWKNVPTYIVKKMLAKYNRRGSNFLCLARKFLVTYGIWQDILSPTVSSKIVFVVAVLVSLSHTFVSHCPFVISCWMDALVKRCLTLKKIQSIGCHMQLALHNNKRKKIINFL